MRDEYHTNPSYIIPTQSKITKGLRTRSIVDQEAEISGIADYDSLIGDIGDEQKEMDVIHKFSQATQRKFTLKSSPKLDEDLTGYKAISEEYSLETYIQKIVSDGDVEDFYGNWGLVLSVKNKPYVYKIWYDDPPFEYYADFCIKNQNISFVPKVYGKVRTIPLTFIRDISKKDAKIKALKIEKLSSVSSWDEVTDIIFESINFNTYDNGDRNEMRGILQSSTSIKELLSGYYGKLTPYGYQWVKDLMENMDKITDNGKMSKDIRLPNIMKTSDNKLKITDPIYNMADIDIYPFLKEGDSSCETPMPERSYV
jgi:hypothetical protein